MIEYRSSIQKVFLASVSSVKIISLLPEYLKKSFLHKFFITKLYVKLIIFVITIIHNILNSIMFSNDISTIIKTGHNSICWISQVNCSDAVCRGKKLANQ